ncbi:MAG: hypothetical protein K2H30_01895 [Clostridia bacterium]|nr:hypothetical protein [Clostridia bacterium]
MKKVFVDNFINAKGTVKGRLHLFFTVFVFALAVILTIGAIMLYVQFKDAINMFAVWITYGCIMFFLLLIYVYGRIVQAKVRARVCLAVYEDYLVVYAHTKLFEWAYYNIDFSEINGYIFIPVKMHGAKRPYLQGDLLNYGNLELSLEHDKTVKVPIEDIATARELLNEFLPVKETPYC